MKKLILVENCLECPLINECKEWSKIPKKQQFLLTCGVGIKVGILKTCPLDDAPAD